VNYHFCTCFDRNYLVSGYTLYRSLCRHVADFTLYAAALDDETYRLLEALRDPRLVPVRLAEIEAFDPEFAACRANRSRVEYIFTMSPVLPRFLFERHPGIEILNYLDADLFFFRDPEPAYRELGGKALLICPHRFPPELKFREKFGLYNMAFQLYRRGPECFKVLGWWRARCIEWCCDRVEADRFADQKYLDSWPELTDSLVVSRNPGIDAGPWNWMTTSWEETADRRWNPAGSELVFYHYQGFRFLLPFLLSHNLGSYGFRMPRPLRRYLYGTYADAFVAAKKELSRKFPEERFELAMRSHRTGFSTLRAILSGLRHHNLFFRGGTI
jgi:hypothetical protein